MVAEEQKCGSAVCACACVCTCVRAHTPFALFMFTCSFMGCSECVRCVLFGALTDERFMSASRLTFPWRHDSAVLDAWRGQGFHEEVSQYIP